MLIEQLAFGRQVQSPCGAVEQAGVEPAFQAGDALADRGGRYAQLLGGRGEAAAFDCLNEGNQAADVVHMLKPYFEPWVKSYFATIPLFS
ncbi:hypothetical protein D3C78_1086170 [compost metagenome]